MKVLRMLPPALYGNKWLNNAVQMRFTFHVVIGSDNDLPHRRATGANGSLSQQHIYGI